MPVQNATRKPVDVTFYVCDVTQQTKDEIIAWVVANQGNAYMHDGKLWVKTPDGDQVCIATNRVVRTQDGDFFVVKALVFLALYNVV